MKHHKPLKNIWILCNTIENGKKCFDRKKVFEIAINTMGEFFEDIEVEKKYKKIDFLKNKERVSRF